jgi:hypothetical protein
MADDKSAMIKAWQNKLLAAFSQNGTPGGRFLANAIAEEQKTGAEFMDKYYGHRVLTDSFMEFFGEALHSQWAYNNSKGWPQNLPHYGPGLILYLTVYRSIRSSEVLSANGYVLAAYAVQRTIKDQLMVLGAAANGFADFSELFGWKEIQGKDWTEAQKVQLIKSRQKFESKIREKIMGKRSELPVETQAELARWDHLFNWEVHRSLFSYTRAAQRLFVDRDLSFKLGPSPDDLAAAMFLNRSMELNWIALRLLPYMRRPDTPPSEDWNAKWSLLDESFKFMFDGFNELGKKIAPAYYEMLQAKFKFDPGTYFIELKAAGTAAEGAAKPTSG